MRSQGDQPLLVTQVIAAACLIVFALCMLNDKRLPLGFDGGFRVSTLLRWGALAGALGKLEPWRYLSAVLVHMSVLHVAFNLIALLDLGRALEPALGRGRFALLFVLSGGLGFVASDLWYGASGPLTAGASGGIFGLMGAAIGLLYARRDPRWKQTLLHNAVYAAIFAVAFNVNTVAHLGGFAIGALTGYGFAKLPGFRKGRMVWGVLGALALAVSAAAVVLSAVSPVWRLVQSEEQLR